MVKTSFQPQAPTASGILALPKFLHYYLANQLSFLHVWLTRPKRDSAASYEGLRNGVRRLPLNLCDRLSSLDIPFLA